MIHHEPWFQRQAVSTDLEEAVRALTRAPSEPDLWVRYFHVAQRYNDFNAAKSLLPKASPKLIESLAQQGFVTLSWKIGTKQNKSALEAANENSSVQVNRVAQLPDRKRVSVWGYDAVEVFRKFARVTALTVLDKWEHPEKAKVEAFLRAENPTEAQADEAYRIARAATGEAREAAVEAEAALATWAAAAWAWSAAAAGAAAGAWAAEAGGPPMEESNALLERMLVEGAPNP